MPILESAVKGTPLSQGDILQDIPLFLTNVPASGHVEEKKVPLGFCLVLSRPCVTAHKKQIVVAQIRKFDDKLPKEITTAAKVLEFLKRLRDGHGSPDVFYLGHIPDQNGRFCARFDSIYTIAIPDVETERQAFVDTHRVATIHADFTRDLHVRLFSAFASLGFNDNGWFSTGDLEWLVNQGRADISEAETIVNAEKAKQSSQEAQGKPFDKKTLAEAEVALTNLREDIGPYAAELERRRKE